MCISLSRQADLCIFSVDLIQKSIVSQILVVGLDTFASNGRWCYKKERLNKKIVKKDVIDLCRIFFEKNSKKSWTEGKNFSKREFPPLSFMVLLSDEVIYELFGELRR